MPNAPAIVRSWSARATPAGAEAYLEHFRSTVLPTLRGLSGHRGAWVLKRPEGDKVRIAVLTFWASRGAIEAFAGADVTAAVVEPHARAVLSSFDARAEHFELALDTLT